MYHQLQILLLISNWLNSYLDSLRDVWLIIKFIEITIKHIKRGVKEVGKALRKKEKGFIYNINCVLE